MKKIFETLFLILVLSIGFGAVLLYYVNSQKEDGASISPLPEFLTLSKNRQVRFLDLWLPDSVDAHENKLPEAEITAKSILMYDLVSNQAIFERSAKERMPMASLTKIMTAIIAIENKKGDNRYFVSEGDLVGENSMGLSLGEVLTLEELLYGLMLPSGNDAAEVLASNHQAGRGGFINDMNEKAQALGLKDTNFTNPSGLQGDGEQYTTAYDMLVITRYALESYPLFAKVVSTPQYSIPQSRSHKSYDLINETNLLTTYEGVKGVKTGYTDEAGLCLVTYIDYKGHKIIGIILNSENRRMEMKALLDYSLKSFGLIPPEYKG